MWPTNYQGRLESWVNLRKSAASADLNSSLILVNKWWFNTPWSSYYLHWDDRDTWPDPWQLLQDNIFCDLARGLGMLYTLTMLERPDITDAVLTETGQDNLVLIGSGKYVLNWNPDEIVNIKPVAPHPRRQILQQSLKIR